MEYKHIIRNKITIMPNADDGQINELLSLIKGKEDGQDKLVCFTKISPKPITLKTDSIEEDNWLLNNWGTRNKAFNTCWASDNEIIFDTEWHPSIPIFCKIVKMLPHINLTFTWASDKAGVNTGTIYSNKGNLDVKTYSDFSKMAYETGFELRPAYRQIYTYNDKIDSYEYDISDFIHIAKEKGVYKDTDGSKYQLLKTDDLPF